MIYLIKTVIAIKNASFFIYTGTPVYIYIKTMNAVQVSINPPKILSTKSFVGTAKLFIYA